MHSRTYTHTYTHTYTQTPTHIHSHTLTLTHHPHPHPTPQDRDLETSDANVQQLKEQMLQLMDRLDEAEARLSGEGHDTSSAPSSASSTPPTAKRNSQAQAKRRSLAAHDRALSIAAGMASRAREYQQREASCAHTTATSNTPTTTSPTSAAGRVYARHRKHTQSAAETAAALAMVDIGLQHCDHDAASPLSELGGDTKTNASVHSTSAPLASSATHAPQTTQTAACQTARHCADACVQAATGLASSPTYAPPSTQTAACQTARHCADAGVQAAAALASSATYAPPPTQTAACQAATQSADACVQAATQGADACVQAGTQRATARAAGVACQTPPPTETHCISTQTHMATRVTRPAQAHTALLAGKTHTANVLDDLTQHTQPPKARKTRAHTRGKSQGETHHAFVLMKSTPEPPPAVAASDAALDAASRAQPPSTDATYASESGAAQDCSPALDASLAASNAAPRAQFSSTRAPCATVDGAAQQGSPALDSLLVAHGLPELADLWRCARQEGVLSVTAALVAKVKQRDMSTARLIPDLLSRAQYAASLQGLQENRGWLAWCAGCVAAAAVVSGEVRCAPDPLRVSLVAMLPGPL